MKQLTSQLAVLLLATLIFKDVASQTSDGQSKSSAATPGSSPQSKDEHKQQEQQEQRDLQQNAFQKYQQLEKEAAELSDEDDDSGEALESGFEGSYSGDIIDDDLLQEGKRYKPRFVGKRYQPRFVGKRYKPRFVGKRYKPRFVGKRYKPRFVGKRQDYDQANGAVHTIEKRSLQDPYDPSSYWWDAYPGLESSFEDDSSDSSEFGPDSRFAKRQAPRFVGKRQAPRFVGKRQAPRFVGKRSLLYRRGGAPRFVGKRQAPRFVGKRESDIMELLEALEAANYKKYIPRLHGKRDQTETYAEIEARGDDYMREYLANWSRNRAIKRHQAQPRRTASGGEGGIIGKRGLSGSSSGVEDADDNMQEFFL